MSFVLRWQVLPELHRSTGRIGLPSVVSTAGYNDCQSLKAILHMEHWSIKVKNNTLYPRISTNPFHRIVHGAPKYFDPVDTIEPNAKEP